MANISRLAESSGSKFRALNKRYDMKRALYYQLQSIGRADALCLSKWGHFKFEVHSEHPAFSSWLHFPHWGDGADRGHLLAKRLARGELCLSNVGSSPLLGCAREGPRASAKTDGDPHGLTEPSARTTHGHLAQGNTSLGAYMKNNHFFAFREKQLKYYFCLARRHFHSWHVSRQEEFAQRPATGFAAGFWSKQRLRLC